jgi:hypothetical protein
MKNRLIIVLVIVTLFSFNSCAQKSKKQENMKTEYIDKINNIYKEVKKYDYNPIYQLKVTNNLCTYEIFINGLLVDYSFGTGRSAGEQNIDIPQYILKSGLQSIKIKAYPKAIKNGELENVMDTDADLKVRIVHGEYYKEKFENFKEDFKMNIPKIGFDLPFIELEGKFAAKVPYVLEGWSKGIDLSKEDQGKLEKEVLTRMKEIANLYKNKDIEGLAKEQYKRTKEIDQSMYQNAKENSSEWAVELQEALNESTEIELLDGEMKIMGGDKLVTVLVKDGKYRNQSIIRSKVDGFSDFYPQYFYRPKLGSRLEVIR